MSSSRRNPAIPQPRPLPVIGNVASVDPSHPVQSFMALAREYGPLFRMEFPANTILVASSHALVAELCDERRFDKYVHGPLQHIRDFAGDGLFTARTEEANWGRAHRILMPAFGPAAMRGYFELMLDVADQLVTKWERLGPGAELDVADNMTRLTLDTIALCGFGYRFNSFYAEALHPFVDAMVRSLAEAGARSRRLPIHTRLLEAVHPQYEKDLGYMNAVVDEVIRERRAQGGSGSKRDLLGLMLEGKDATTGAGLDDLNIRYQIVTFLIAGHETTSGLLAFTVYQLLRHPELLAQAQAEVDRVFGSDPKHLPTFDEVRKLELLDRILKESLRVWPTAPAFALKPRQETVVHNGITLTPEDNVLVLTPMLHRDPEVWPDPERFDPDRFLPEAVAARSPHAWKPFGNGQRACIGREFAMLEARLVLGMVLHRFSLAHPRPYRLQIKETLTLKPEGLVVHARRRTPAVTEPLALHPAQPRAAQPAAGVAPVSNAHGTPLSVLYGSNTGTAEAFARRIAADASARGFHATVAPLDAAVGQLSPRGAVLIVTASYNGQPPDNARAFVEWVQQLPEGALSGVRYAVFGCGSRDWASTYQAVPTRVDEALQRAGATRLAARGEADSSGDLQGDFDGWYAPLWGTVETALELQTATTATAEAPSSRLEVTTLRDGEEPLAAAHRLVTLEVVENRELVEMTSPFARSKRHLVFRLPEGMSYRAGDHLEVLPANPPAQVERAARRFGLSLEARVVVRAAGGASSSLLPLGQAISVRELLSRHLELSAPATRRAVKALAERTRCPPEKMKLEQLAGVSYQDEVAKKRVSALDLLETFAACELTFAAFLELVPAIKPRRYSVSSSPLANPGCCSLTVAVLDAPALSGRGRYLGTCSTYLAGLKPGDTVLGAIRSPTTEFRPPEDPSIPVVMACAGTGLAPFRGFIEERVKRAESGEKLAPAVLFFGCDHPEVDFLYRPQLEAWQAQGAVEVYPAFFRQEEDGVTFVQHRLWRERARVAELFSQGARVYVCGDGARMAPAVRETVGRIEAERHRLPESASAEQATKLERAGRYLVDAFG